MIGKTNAQTLGGSPPAPTTGDYLVRYFNIDGTILKEQWVDSGQDATPPSNPTYDSSRLTFNSWNLSCTNITKSTDIGAIYDTVNNKTYAKIILTTASGLSPTLYLNKSDGSTLTIDWGDSTQNTYTNSGNFNTGSHTYSAVGEYWISMWISTGTGSYNLGNNSVTTCFVGGSEQKYKETLVKLYASNIITSLLNYVFFNNYSLNVISLSTSLINITLGAFYNCYTFQNINIPTSVTTIGANTFYSNIGLEQLYISSISTVSSGMLNSCYGLKTLSFSSNVTSIEVAAFNNCFGILKYKFYRTTPPTLSSINVFTGITSICKIYVPDASVAAYKAATNWSTYANYIYPLSDIGE